MVCVSTNIMHEFLVICIARLTLGYDQGYHQDHCRVPSRASTKGMTWHTYNCTRTQQGWSMDTSGGHMVQRLIRNLHHTGLISLDPIFSLTRSMVSPIVGGDG